LCFAPLFSAVQTEHAVAYFSPEDQLEKRLIGMINKERKSVQVAIYSLTHRGIGKALIEAKKRGVFVEVVIDRASIKIRSPIQKMVEAGIPVYVWEPERDHQPKSHRSLMHNKFCVFGDETVWTGSFNFTYEASRAHQENAVVLRDSALAAAYKGQFHQMKHKSCVPYTSYIATHTRPKTKLAPSKKPQGLLEEAREALR
jgi:phosphatidylserine/phosphatidylglycerophosphate/cardiolipin synthase-like enzyme